MKHSKAHTQPCSCGKAKRRRHLCCRECYGKMPEKEKGIYRANDQENAYGSLRRWSDGERKGIHHA